MTVVAAGHRQPRRSQSYVPRARSALALIQRLCMSPTNVAW